MPDPLPPDPHRPPSAAVDEIAADLERLRRASERRPLRLRLRREVRRAELALLAFGVVAAGFLALHLAERGNEVSLTARTAASSSTSPPAPGHAKPGHADPEPATSPPSEQTSPAPASRTTTSVTSAPPSPPTRDTPTAVDQDTATTVPTPEVEPPSTTTTSTTSSTTTTTSTTTTLPAP